MDAKLISATALYVLWAVLVYLGKADADGLVQGIQAALIGLGVYHTALKDPKQ